MQQQQQQQQQQKSISSGSTTPTNHSPFHNYQLTLNSSGTNFTNLQNMATPSAHPQPSSNVSDQVLYLQEVCLG